MNSSTHPAIFYFRPVVDKKLQTGQGLYRPLACKKVLKEHLQEILHFKLVWPKEPI